MRLLSSLLAFALGTTDAFRRYHNRGQEMSRTSRDMVADSIDMSKWQRAPQGGYQQATCKCEIECTPDSINEICGADVAIALDMSTCDKEKWARMEQFVNKLVQELEIEQKLGGERNTARVAVMTFAAEPNEVIGFTKWNVENIFRPKQVIEEAFSEINRNSQWTLFTGMGVDFEKAFDWAGGQFKSPRNPGAVEELEELNFETTKMFVIVSDGRTQRSKNAAQMRSDLMMAKTDLNGKVITVSQSASDSPNCRNGGIANCPDKGFLGEIGDVFVDGGDVVDAAREVATIINSKKCVKHGECKPCNCECSFPRGPAGPEGDEGCIGQKGPCGGPGLEGPTGADGNIGPNGQKGVKGVKGDCGDDGVPGEKGPPGEPAPTGDDAKVGPEGMPGERGKVGEPGQKGDKGYSGNAGPMGDPGPVGPPGPAGKKGPQGEPGGLILQNGRSNEVMSPEKYMEAIRIIVQEWMQKEENREILECISECDENKKESKFADLTQKCPPGSHFEEENTKNNGQGSKVGPTGGPRGPGVCVKDPDVDACKEPLDIVFLVDGSDSIREDDWPLVGKWTTSLLDMIKPVERAKDTRVIYQQYSSHDSFPEAIKYTITSETNPSHADPLFEGLKREITDQKQMAQGTHTYQALNEIYRMFPTELRSTTNGMDDNGDSDGVTTILVTLTDGEARDQAYRADDIMMGIRQRVDVMASIGVGNKVLENELKDIANDEEHILMYKNYQSLEQLAYEIIQLIGRDCDKQAEQKQWPSREALRRHIQPASSRGPLETIDQDSSSAPDDDGDFLEFSRYLLNGREDRRHRHRK